MWREKVTENCCRKTDPTLFRILVAKYMGVSTKHSWSHLYPHYVGCSRRFLNPSRWFKLRSGYAGHGYIGSILSVSSVSTDLSTALMLVEVNEARDASDNVCRFVHHNHGSCTETSLCPDQVIKVHEHIITYTETQRSKSMSIKRGVNET